MMIPQHTGVPAEMNHKKELLSTLYGVYSRWVARFPLACQKGCSACCTQSVTMSTLEGELVLDFVKTRGREQWMLDRLAQAERIKSGAAITTNQYAMACLAHQEVDDDTLGSWNFTPCVFLVEKKCSIYEVRPFGCRSFGSLVRCSGNAGAETAPLHLTVNTVFTQIVEHLCSDGGYWGNMADILQDLAASEASCPPGNLLPALPVPGFFLEPYEVKEVHILLRQLCEQSSEKQTFGDLIDNFMPI